LHLPLIKPKNGGLQGFSFLKKETGLEIHMNQINLTSSPKKSKKDTHQFLHRYKGLGAFGMDRKTDEETIMFYLQKFSEDTFMAHLLPLLDDDELDEIYALIHRLLKRHLSEDKYHTLFLKDR